VGCRFASVSDDLDLTTPDGELKMMMLAMFAHYFRRQLSRKVRGGQAERAKQGKRHGERPYGYQPDGDSWRPDPAEAPVVQQVYQWYYQDHQGFRAIAKRLNLAGVLGQKGRLGTWDARTVERMLRREAYAGDTIYQKWLQETDRDGHRHLKRNTPTIIRNTHPPLIDRATWNAVQERLAVRQQLGRRTHSSPYLLSGLVRCGACGSSMGVVRIGQRREDGRRDPVFCCQAYHTKGLCSRATVIPVADLEQAVLATLRAELAQAQTRPTPAQVAVWLEDDPAISQARAQRRQAEQRLATLPGMLARAEEMALQGAYTIDEYRRSKSRLETEQAQWQSILEQPLPLPANPDVVAERLAQLASQYEAVLSTDPRDGRPWVQDLIDNIVCYSGRRVEITWRTKNANA
jgi:hypothetical protein